MNPTKEKPGARGGEQTGLDTAETYTANDTAGHGIRQRVKRVIVGAACWGFLPAGFASWLIQRGGMRDA